LAACDGFGLDVFEDIKAEPGVVVRKGSLKAKSNRRKVKSMGTESQLYTEMRYGICMCFFAATVHLDLGWAISTFVYFSPSVFCPCE
jgi:hypothetical protein